ncbi:MAG: NDP-sugar synthase [Actinobacteria bacterium]|nr:NDP-sugar synthase [Actinomycetota bacterium]NBP54609.1 NDP-sugar synthase [Actinomycetota bacterium]
MDAVILVGGFGTRLRPLTLSVPKPLLPVGNVPIVERIIASLERAGVTRAVLALGFKPEPFIAAFPDGRCGGVALDYAVEPEPLDTAGAIAFAARHARISSTFVVANGDILTSLDVSRIVDFHRESGAEGTLHLVPVDDPSQFGVVETDPSGRVRRFVEKPAPGQSTSRNVNAGTYVLEPSVIDRVPLGGKVSIERVVFPAMVESASLFAVATDDAWIDTGRPETFLAANLATIDAAGGSIIDPSARVGTGCLIERSVVGAGATVDAGARITGSVVFPGASIGVGASVDASLIMGRVGDRVVAVDVVVGEDGVIDDGARISGAKIPVPEGS